MSGEPVRFGRGGAVLLQYGLGRSSAGLGFGGCLGAGSLVAGVCWAVSWEVSALPLVRDVFAAGRVWSSLRGGGCDRYGVDGGGGAVAIVFWGGP